MHAHDPRNSVEDHEVAKQKGLSRNDGQVHASLVALEQSNIPRTGTTTGVEAGEPRVLLVVAETRTEVLNLGESISRIIRERRYLATRNHSQSTLHFPKSTKRPQPHKTQPPSQRDVSGSDTTSHALQTGAGKQEIRIRLASLDETQCRRLNTVQQRQSFVTGQSHAAM